MSEHYFTIDLHLSDNDGNLDDIVERLGANGCTDATIGLGRPGTMRLVFVREAASEADAFSSAFADVNRAVPSGKALLVDTNREEF